MISDAGVLLEFGQSVIGLADKFFEASGAVFHLGGAESGEFLDFDHKGFEGLALETEVGLGSCVPGQSAEWTTGS